MNAISLYKHLDQMLPWNDRLQVLECISVVDEAPQVKTFTFRSDNQTWFRYQPGQFITLEVPVPGGPLMRTYTLSSSPSRPFSIAVTAKAQAGSVATQWMFDSLKVGGWIKAFGPAGEFSLHNHPSAKYLFISAGSGVTPMMSMTRWLNDCSPETDIAFVNCARRPEEIIFRAELELLGRWMPGLTLGFLIEERSNRESWSGHMGRIDAVRLPLLSPDFRDRMVFCCGPDPFMRAVRAMLESAGFDMANYHQESFGAGAGPTIVPVEPALPGATPTVSIAGDATPIRFSLSDVDATCLSGQTILQTARAAGVRIPAACEFGLCGTCKVRCTGPVEMAHNGGIRDDEIEDGFVLACCSRPRGAVEIEA